MKTRQQTGFTLIELMITLLIASIVLGVGAPMMGNFLKNDRLTAFANSLRLDLMLARSKAVELVIPVMLCASSNGETCNSEDLNDGWIVITAPVGDPEAATLVKVQQEPASDIELKLSDGGLSSITFNSSGFTPDIANGESISVCDDRGDDYAKALSFSRTGRISRGTDPSC